MLEWIFWLSIAGVLVLASRYAIARFLGSDEEESTRDRPEIRLQSAMRWFTAFWPDTSERQEDKSR